MATAIERAPPLPKLPPRLPTPDVLSMLPRSTASTRTGAVRSQAPPARPPPHTSAPLRITASTTSSISLTVSATDTVMFTLNEPTAAVMETATATVVALTAGTPAAVPASAVTVTPVPPVTVAPSMRASTWSASVFLELAPAPVRPTPTPLDVTPKEMLAATTMAVIGMTELASTVTVPPAVTTVVAPSIEARMSSRTTFWATATATDSDTDAPPPPPMEPPNVPAPTLAIASPVLAAETTMSPLAVSWAPLTTLASMSLAIVFNEMETVTVPLMVAPLPDTLSETPTATMVEVMLASAVATTVIEPAVAVTVAASMWANSSSVIVLLAPAPPSETVSAMLSRDAVMLPATAVAETSMMPLVVASTVTAVPTTLVVAPAMAASRPRSITLRDAATPMVIAPPWPIVPESVAAMATAEIRPVPSTVTVTSPLAVQSSPVLMPAHSSAPLRTKASTSPRISLSTIAPPRPIAAVGLTPLGTATATDAPIANTSIVAVMSACTSMPSGAVSVDPSTMARTAFPRSPPMALTATAMPMVRTADTVSEPRLSPNVTPIVRAQIVGLPPADCGIEAVTSIV